MDKPAAIKEVEADVAAAMNKAWAKLAEATPTITEEDLPLIIQASRANRERWLVKQRKKKNAGDDEDVEV